jgi:RIP metalloprotease RseP
MSMLADLSWILAAVLGLAFVIAIHELGHFLFAKWAGVRVDRFSIGFGPVILAKRWGETEYALSLVPLGGYVKMLGQEDVPGKEAGGVGDPRSYLSKSAGWRALILLGGVLFNLVSSWIILVIIALYGVPLLPPVAGGVEPIVITQRDGVDVEVPGPAAQAGLRQGDRVVAVNGARTYNFEDVLNTVITGGSAPLVLTVERGGQRLDLPPLTPVYASGLGRPTLGMAPALSDRVAFTGVVGATTAADLRIGDRILAIAGEATTGVDGAEILRRLEERQGQQVALRVLRDGVEQDLVMSVGSGSPALPTALGLPLRVDSITPGSHAAASGLRSGDVLVAANGERLHGWTHLGRLTEAAGRAGTPLLLDLQRRDTTGAWAAATAAITPRHDVTDGRHRLGVLRSNWRSGVLPALPLLPGGATAPLERAGLQPGNIIVGTPQPRGEQRVALQVLPPGPVRLLPIGEATWNRWSRGWTASPILRMFGMQDRPRVRGVLDGASIIAVANDGPALQLTVADQRGQTQVLSLEQLDNDERAVLASLPVGGWIAAVDVRDAAGRRCLEVALPQGSAAPRQVDIAAADLGTDLLLRPAREIWQADSLGEAMGWANHAAVQMVVSSLRIIPRLFAKPEDGGIEASRTLSGPIGIFNILKMSIAEDGLAGFLRIVALIGLNLFLINLLPIPLVDGGQLMFLGIETIIRRPVPPVLFNIANYIGLGLILFMMGFTVLNDLATQIFGL